MLENRFMSKITIYPCFSISYVSFHIKNNGTKGNYFQKKFIKLNIQLGIYYSYKSSDSIHPFLSSGNHFHCSTNNNFLKSVELDYQFFKKACKGNPICISVGTITFYLYTTLTQRSADLPIL